MSIPSRLLVPVLGLAIALTAPAAADAAAAPPADPNAAGSIGLCDAQHRQVRGGLLAAAPFAWTAASSVAAPEGYERGKAALFAYQPRRGVDPGDWSGKQLTASSTFSNAKHPMSAGTRIDASLSDFTATFPAQYDGLVQLRLYFAAANRPQYSGPYPAVYLRVSGARWTQLGGADVDCAAGRSRSVELDSLPAARLTVRNPRPEPESATVLKARAANPTAPGTGSAPGSGGTATGRPTTGGAGGPASVDARPAASRSKDARGVGGWVWLPVLALAALAVGAVVARRRRTA